MEEQVKKSGIKREVLFFILFAVCAISLFIPVNIPNRVSDSSADLYKMLKSLPEDKIVLVQSDWTNSTRGESRAQFQATIRTLMSRNIKFGFLSVGDAQAPEVARTTIEELNKERTAQGLPAYRPWEDFVYVGFFPGAEATVQAFASNFGSAISSKTDVATDGSKRPILQSPVMAGIQKIGDLGAYLIVTGTKSSRISIERLSGRVPMGALVTGVMGPETYNYYQTGQLGGLSIGLKGAYDMESMMSTGLNMAGGSVTSKKVTESIEPVPGMDKVDKNAQRYIVPLHGAILLLIIAVVLGNIELIRSRKAGGK